MVSWEEQPLPRSFDSVFYGAAGTPTGASDNEFNRVSFLSHFDGANNGVNNAFDDGSTDNLTVTAAGSVTQGSFGPFARPAGNFSQRNYASVGGTTNQTSWVQAPDSADFDLLVTGDFTIEFWVNFLKTEATIIFGQSNGGGGQPKWNLNLDQAIADNLAFHLGGGGNLGVPFAPDANRWYYIAVTRDGNNYRFYADGAQLGSTVSSSARSSASSAVLQIGAGESYLGLGGYISNLRFVKGTALYTGSTHAVPTGPTTKVTNTVLLCCQDNSFIDNSDSAHVLTPNKLNLANYAEASSFGPFLTSSVYDPAVNGASARFRTVSNFLALPSNSLNLGNNNFTIETWVYTSSTAQQLIVGSCVGSNGYGSYMFNINYNSDKVRFFCRYAGGNVLSYTVESGSFPINSWTHLAATRDGANLRVFINGTQAGSTNTTLSTSAIDAPRGGQNTQGTTDVYYVGKTSDGSLPIIGSLCDLRVIVGTAVYTSNFTSPTAPLTAVTNTKLLLNMADGKAFDSAAHNDMVLSGNANTSTDQAKFGDTSLHLDGSGDFAYLTDPSVGHFIAGNFTAECWVYPTASPSQPIIMGQWSGSNSWAIQMSNNSSRYLRFLTSATGDTVSSTAVALNQWSHVALVRNGSAFAIYLNGTSVATASSSNALLASGNALSIGANLSGGQPYTGYIDEVRISKMARYTSNFTAPDESFADKGK